MKDRHLRDPEGDLAGARASGLEGPERPGWRPIGVPTPRESSAPGWSGPALPTLRRRDPRVYTEVAATTMFIDPVRDPVTNETCYHTSDEDTIVSLSRRGAGLRCVRPPRVGTRVLLQIHCPGEGGPIEVIGRTCWTRVEYVPGELGARAVAAIGVEFMGGCAETLDRYEGWLDRITRERAPSVATPEATG